MKNFWDLSKPFALQGGLFLIYFLAGKFGLSLAFLNSSASPVWPPTGIALAAALLFGYRIWPAILAGAFMVNLTNNGSVPASLMIALGNCGETLIAAWFANRLAGGIKAFDSVAGIARFALAATVGPAFSASIGVSALVWAGLASRGEIPAVWLTWWSGDFISACMLAPFLILVGRDILKLTPEFDLRVKRESVLEGLALGAAVFIVGQLVFGGFMPNPLLNLPTPYLLLPLLIWACLRFGRKTTMACVIVMAGESIYGTLHGYGAFAVQDRNLSLLLLQAFLVTISFTSLVLGAVIASRRQARRDLEISENRFRQLAENIREVFYVFDPRTKTIAYLSPAFENLWGAPRRKLYSQPATFLVTVHPEDLAQVKEALVRRAHGEETRDEYRIVRPDGSIRWISDHAFPVRDDQGTLRSITGLALDITASRASEEKLRGAEERIRQSQKVEAVGRLAGSVAHDFNNLLTAINGYGEVLLSRLEPGDKNRVYVEEIRKAGDRAALVTQQLLAFSRKQTVAPAILDLNNVVTDLQMLLVRLLGENVHFKAELGKGLARIKADAGQIAQVVMNLVLNSRDAMPTGGKLRISTFNAELTGKETDFYLKPQPGSYVGLVIRDSGIGMAPDVKAHLFEPFYTTKEKAQGTGLGLSTVFGCMQQNRGAIRIVSEPDKGTAFFIYFRKDEEDWTQSLRAAETAQSEAETDRKGRSETILVVEDEENVRKLVKHVLSAQGYTVLEASGAREAMYMHENHPGPIHLLLTDIVLSGKSGREIAKEFLELRPGIRVVYMSGYTDDTEFRKELEKSNAQFLGKPFTPTRLLQKVRDAFLGAESGTTTAGWAKT